MSPEGQDKSKVSFKNRSDPLWRLRLDARKGAKEMQVVYQEFLDAGFDEEQALAVALVLLLWVNFTGEEK
jgi:hypothetical protein